MKEAPAQFVAPVVPGFAIKKLLAASHRSAVHLATDKEGRWVALKTLRLPTGVDRAAWASRWSDLQKLTTSGDGLVPVFEFGEVEGADAWYYSMPAADDASDEAAGNPTLYNPLTLRLRLKVGGPLAISEVIDLGISLAEALKRLHAAGFIHRDVKPSNMFFVGGEPRLGDYDLSLAPATESAPRGTEGFYPLEEALSSAADIYALGKTLYEAWTGLDRLEFPSLPPGLAGGREWITKGADLNRLLLKACDVRPSGRFANVSALQVELKRLQTSNGATALVRRTSRNTITITAALAGVALIGVWWTLKSPETKYDAAKEFSATSNPSGVWSYGYSPNRLNAFTLFSDGPESVPFPQSSVLVVRWGRNLPFPANHPAIMQNRSQVDLTRTNNSDVVLSAGALTVSSGGSPNPSYGVIRFTCPKGGFYSIDVEFSGVAFSGSHGGTTSDVHVLINGSSVFDADINGFGEKQRYVSPVRIRLSAGTTVDFAVGPGSNRNSSSDWTGLTAVVLSWRR